MGENWIVWMSRNPTAENMAREIWNNLIPSLEHFKNTNKSKGIELDSVTVYETATNSATYKEKDD
jgi:6-pyruvoyl-tetrahydropterin synthase